MNNNFLYIFWTNATVKASWFVIFIEARTIIRASRKNNNRSPTEVKFFACIAYAKK